MLVDVESIKYKLRRVRQNIMQYEIAMGNSKISDAEREYFVDLVGQEDSLIRELIEATKKEIEYGK